MNAKSMLLMMVALGCGLVAAVGVFQYLDTMPGVAAEDSQYILIAKQEIDIRQPFTQENVERISWPKNRVPLGAVTEYEGVDGKFARTRLYPGEPILQKKVMGENDNSGSLKVPAGFRVVAVEVNAESSVSSLIQPGDRVDVVAVLKKSQDNPYPFAFSKTILKAVRVFAVNREMTRLPEYGDEPIEARTVSLLVTPDQAETFLMARELGTLQLALRGANDPTLEETSGATVDRILGRGEAADDVGAKLSVPKPLRQEAPEAPVATAAEPVWEMTVLSPLGVKRYTWDDESTLPKASRSRPAPPQALEKAPEVTQSAVPGSAANTTE